jgi:hypothetical protein
MGNFRLLVTFGILAPIFWATLCFTENATFTCDENGLGYILGEFLLKSSGHPDEEGRGV